MDSLHEIPAWLTAGSPPAKKCSARLGFLRRTQKNFSRVLENDFLCETYSGKDGLLQGIDPRAKIMVFLAYLLFSAFTQDPVRLIVIAAAPFFYGAASGLRLRVFFRRVWLTVPLLVFLLTLFGTCGIFQGGLSFAVPVFSVGGAESALRAALRTGISLSFAALLLMTTKRTQLAASLASFHIPGNVVAVIDLTYRYLFFLTGTASDMIDARFLRTAGKVASRKSRDLTAGSLAVLFLKSRRTGDEVYGAMQCRGYGGDFRMLCRLRFRTADAAFLILNFVMLAGIGLFL